MTSQNQPGTALVNYEQKWEEQAKRAAEAEPQQPGQFLSTKGGILMMGEQALPGNQVICIILDSLRENSFYTEKWDEQDPKPPVCYAFGRDGDDMTPHESMRKQMEMSAAKGDTPYFQPQHFPCQGCWANEWGSANQGRGKACQNRRRLTIIPAGYFTPKPKSRDFDTHLFTDPAHFQSVDYAFLRLPVTSVTGWAKYVQQLATNMRRPPHGVITRLFVEPDAKTQYRVGFEMQDLVPDELASIIMARNAACELMPEKGYETPDPERNKTAPAGFRRPGV